MKINKREMKVFLALRDLYRAGRWMLPTEDMQEFTQTALWEQAKQALKEYETTNLERS